jgi:hypothetical protein
MATGLLPPRFCCHPYPLCNSHWRSEEVLSLSVPHRSSISALLLMLCTPQRSSSLPQPPAALHPFSSPSSAIFVFSDVPQPRAELPSTSKSPRALSATAFPLQPWVPPHRCSPPELPLLSTLLFGPWVGHLTGLHERAPMSLSAESPPPWSRPSDEPPSVWPLNWVQDPTGVLWSAYPPDLAAAAPAPWGAYSPASSVGWRPMDSRLWFGPGQIRPKVNSIVSLFLKGLFDSIQLESKAPEICRNWNKFDKTI